MNSMGGLGSYEWRGGHPVHERAERAEKALQTVQLMLEEMKPRQDILMFIATVLEK